MIPSRSILLGALFLTSADLRAPEGVTFKPQAESTIGKNFTTTVELSLDDFTLEVNGESQDPSMMGIPATLSLDAEMKVGVEDAYAAVSGSRPTDFVRSFEQMDASYSTSEGDSDSSSFDDMVGRAVRFQWNAEDETYDREFTGDGDVSDEAAEYLQVMEVDMDFLTLLPEGEVSEGDEWSVSGGRVLGFLMPSVSIASALELAAEGDDGEAMPAELRQELESVLAGSTARVTYAGTEDGKALLEFRMELDYDTQINPNAMAGDNELPGQMTLEVELDLTIEGTCHWDLAAGRFASCSMEGDGGLTFDVEMSMEEMGMEMAGFAQFSVTVAHEASSESL